MTAIGVIAFVVGLLISIMLHELGHFATAKHYGMKATRFFLGFGPTVWSFRRGETEYGVKALPAGGFVKIVGMTEFEEIEPGDEQRVMWKFPARQRAVVLGAGSFMHFVIAAALAFGVLATVGDLLANKTSLTVSSVSQCLSAKGFPAKCKPGVIHAPAYGKLHVGDRIVAINGTAASSFGPVHGALRRSPGKPVTLTVVRAGVQRTVTITPHPFTIDHRTIGLIGFLPKIAPEQVGIGTAFVRTAGQFGSFLKDTGKGLAALPGEIPKVLRGEPRGANDPGSVIDIARVSGSYASTPNVSTGAKIGAILLLLAEVNLFVGVFNLLPLLPLDGGHLAILGFEKARSAIARRLGRVDPGRVDLLKVMPVTYAVVAVFIGLSLLLLYAGITNPIKIQ